MVNAGTDAELLLRIIADGAAAELLLHFSPPTTLQEHRSNYTPPRIQHITHYSTISCRNYSALPRSHCMMKSSMAVGIAQKWAPPYQVCQRRISWRKIIAAAYI